MNCEHGKTNDCTICAPCECGDCYRPSACDVCDVQTTRCQLSLASDGGAVVCTEREACDARYFAKYPIKEAAHV